MSHSNPTRLKTISDLHRFNNISPPEHPLISLIDYSKINPNPKNNELKWVQQFYTISIKRNVAGKYRYGQESYDFDEGLMTFFSPEQVISVQLIDEDLKSSPSGWILAIHPDFCLSSMCTISEGWKKPKTANRQQVNAKATASLATVRWEGSPKQVCGT